MHLAGLDSVDAHDVESKWTLEHRAHLSRIQREHHPLELGHHRTATVPAQVAASCLRSGIHRLALCDLLEVATLSNLHEERIGLGPGALLLLRRRLGSNYDLPERDRRRLILQNVIVLLERLFDLGVAYVLRSRRLLKIGENTLLERAPVELRVQRPPIFLRSAEAGLLELSAVFVHGLELVAYALELIVDRPVHFALRDFDLHLVRLLHENLLVDE